MVRFGEETLNRNFVSGVSVTDNTIGRPELFCVVQNNMSLRGITVRREVKAYHKAGFAVDYEPNVILFAFDFDDDFISMLLV